MKPATKFRYSFTWAQSVVERLLDKHTRATKLVLELFDMTPNNLAFLLATADPLWPKFRDLVHRVQIWINTRGFRGFTPQMLSILHYYVQRWGSDSMLFRLDKVGKCGTIKEQVSMAGPAAGESLQQGLPFGPEVPSTPKLPAKESIFEDYSI